MGSVVRAHGLKGTLRVRSFAESPRSFEGCERVLLRPKDGPESWEKVEWARPHPKGVLLKLSGINSPESAKLLIGTEIGVDRCDLPDLQDGEYLWTDLIGLTVRTRAGRKVGRIVNLFETGANDVLVVEGSGGEVLIPAVEAAVAAVDLEAGAVILTDMEGLVPEDDEAEAGSGEKAG